MHEILVVDNDDGYIQILTENLRDSMGEPAFVRPLTRVDGVADIEPLLSTTDLVLLDLELKGRRDFNGRDKVLPLIRKHAPWVPVVLMSQYIGGDPRILGQLSPYDFDGVVAKEFFESAQVNEWKELRRMVDLKRVANVTGRTLAEVESAADRKLDVAHGKGVAKALEQFDSGRLATVLRLLELGGGHVVLDEVVQGFSGLAVVRASCGDVDSERQWLVKLGSGIRKLWREALAHRQMFVDGFTRHHSVPLLYWRPVVFRGMGAIAYEFERGATTLLSACEQGSTVQAIKATAVALRELYKGNHLARVIPRKALLARFSLEQLDEGCVDAVTPLQNLVDGAPNKDLDESVETLTGREHGDLHARNVLMRGGSAVLIDFAHYRSEADGGLPLMDMAKFGVDLVAFGISLATPEALANGTALVAGRLGVASRTSLGLVGQLTVGNQLMFRLGVACQMARYCTYEDVPELVKKRMRRALRRAW